MAQTVQSRPAQDQPTLRLSLDSTPLAPSLARAAIATLTQRSELDPTSLATVTLLVSELVSNAVIHSDAPSPSDITLRACVLDPGTVRVEVIDQGNGFSPERRIEARSRGGFGLFLVDTQATRWGVTRDDGTCVWFEIAGKALAGQSDLVEVADASKREVESAGAPAQVQAGP